MSAAKAENGSRMQLRSHPLMSYVGYPNWPPLWAWIEGKENKKPVGEVGILKEVIFYQPSVTSQVLFNHGVRGIAVYRRPSIR